MRRQRDPNQSSTWAITTWGSHCVGTQSLVPKAVTLPGLLSDQLPDEELMAEPEVEVGIGVGEGIAWRGLSGSRRSRTRGGRG